MPTSESLTYRDGTTECRGVLVRPDGPPKAGVLVFHEWFGLGDYEKRRAEQLAQLGYAALAADIYGEGRRAQDADEARSLMMSFVNDPPKLRQRVAVTLQTLQTVLSLPASRCAAIGYCFGGKAALELARSGADLAAVVSFHGALFTAHPAGRGSVKAKLLVLHGAADPLIPAEHVVAFQKEMTEAAADWTLVQYGGVVHSFTNPDAQMPENGLQYHALADRRSFRHMLDLFEEVFGG